jgi:PAS domain S-box-containing protein
MEPPKDVDGLPSAVPVPRPEKSDVERLFDLSLDLLGTAGPDGYFRSLNPAWEKTLGFSRAALMAQPFVEFVHPADREKTLAEAARLRNGVAIVDFENRYAVKDGGWCWLSWRTEVSDDIYCFVARDITGRVAADQRRHLLASVVEGMDDAIFSKTVDGVITSWNQGAESLYGFKAEEAIGHSVNDLIVPTERQNESEAIVTRLVSGEGVRQYTTERKRKDGVLLPVAVTASLLRDDEDQIVGVAVSSRDLSELGLEESRTRQAIDTLAWVGRIRDAIDEQRIIFFAQPIVSLRDDARGYELLCRMLDRRAELVPPAMFLPVAESYGLIEEIDRLAIHEAARRIALGYSISINLSAPSVSRYHTVDFIAEQMRAQGADPARLTIELTETSLMRDMSAAQRFSESVSALGCTLALDDFGTGFGGFTYLKKLKIDVLKIDIEFVRDLADSSASQHLVRAVVSLANGFGIKTIAEGVEDEETFVLLDEYGVDKVQGYLLGRPAAADDVLSGPAPPVDV